MCSISWNVRQSEYAVVFNRDEKWDREKSLNVRFETHHKVPGFCARDARANGTWLFTNKTGLTLALLNAYPGKTVPKSGKKTRGQIPLLAGEVESSGELVQLLQSKSYLDYAPFDLILLESSIVRQFSWDGSRFCEKAIGALPFITSSSVNSERVIAARRKRFEQIRQLPLTEILNDTEAAQPEEAIYVSREDGGTVSQTAVCINRDEIQFSVTRRRESQHIQTIPRQRTALQD